MKSRVARFTELQEEEKLRTKKKKYRLKMFENRLKELGASSALIQSKLGLAETELKLQEEIRKNEDSRSEIGGNIPDNYDQNLMSE